MSLRALALAIALLAAFSAEAKPRALRTLSQPRAARASLPPRAKETSLKLYELVRLGDGLVAAGQVDKAIAFYNDFRFNFANEVVYWRRFSQLYERIGDLEKALGCLDHLPRLEGTELADVVRQAELLWRLRRAEAALARLVGSKEQAGKDDAPYWRLLYDLAWNQEQDLLALEALRRLWAAERDPAVALDLYHLVARTGNYDEASAVALEGLTKGRVNPDLLLYGVRFALEGRRVDVAREMLAAAERRTEGEGSKGEGSKGEGYGRFPELPLARALYTVATGKARAAEPDFVRAVVMQPEGPACQAWLEASVNAFDRSMTARALERCRLQEERRPSSWDVLADVYRVLDRPSESARLRALARERGTWAEPRDYERETPAAEMALVEAIERDDKPEVARLYSAGGDVSLPVQVAALETLDRQDEAWALIEAGGFARDDRRPQSTREAALLRRAFWLREDRLSGAWLTTQASRIGALTTYGVTLRGEQRVRRYYFGAEASQTRLALPRPELLWAGRDETAFGLTARRQWDRHEARLMAGMLYVLPGAYAWKAEAAYSGALWPTSEGPRLHFDADAYFGRLPTLTGLLRSNAVADGLALGATLRLPQGFELRAGGEGSRLGAGDRDLIGYGLTLVAECARRFTLPAPIATVRPRVFLERAMRHNEPYLPTQLLTSVARGAELHEFWLQGYSSAGLGVSLGNALGREVDGKGPHVAYRYSLHAAGSYAWPARAVGVGAEARLSAVFARHQELGAGAFFYSGFERGFGERTGGASLTYSARWF